MIPSVEKKKVRFTPQKNLSSRIKYTKIKVLKEYWFKACYCSSREFLGNSQQCVGVCTSTNKAKTLGDAFDMALKGAISVVT